MSNELIIDDNDRRFAYKGLWEVMRSDTDRQWNRTAHSTWEYNATATLEFTGVQIKVYGTVPAGQGTSAVDFALDGRNGERVWHTSNATLLYGILFFDSGPLSNGAHTIVMSNMGEDNDMDFRLDRVVISQSDAPSNSGSGISSTASNQPSSTTSDNGSKATETVFVTKTGSDTSIIAGSVVGVIVFLAILGSIIFLFLRRQKDTKRTQTQPASEQPQTSSILPTTSSLISPFSDSQSIHTTNPASGAYFSTKPLRTGMNPTSPAGAQSSSRFSYIGSPGGSQATDVEADAQSSTAPPIESEKQIPMFTSNLNAMDVTSPVSSTGAVEVDYNNESPPSYFYSSLQPRSMR